MARRTDTLTRPGAKATLARQVPNPGVCLLQKDTLTTLGATANRTPADLSGIAGTLFNEIRSRHRFQALNSNRRAVFRLLAGKAGVGAASRYCQQGNQNYHSHAVALSSISRHPISSLILRCGKRVVWLQEQQKDLECRPRLEANAWNSGANG